MGTQIFHLGNHQSQMRLRGARTQAPAVRDVKLQRKETVRAEEFRETMGLVTLASERFSTSNITDILSPPI
jgi:hypothetical protein